jgi:hypothetical protein
VYSFESLSLNTKHVSRVVHFTMLATAHRLRKLKKELKC